MFTHLIALNPGGRRIVAVDLADGSVTDVVTGLRTFPDGVVVDRPANLVYWTNMGTPALPRDRRPSQEEDLDFSAPNGSIERVGLDSSDRAVVVGEGSFVTGKQLVAAWTTRRLYWADREGAAVLSASIDGTDIRAEVVTAHSDLDRRTVRNQCVGVAVDERRGQLYWTQKGPSDGGDGRIFRTALDIPAGQSAEHRDVELLWSGLPEPIDLELDLDSRVLYWTDRGAPPSGNTLNRAAIPADGSAGGPVEVVASGFREAIGLAMDRDAGVAYVSDLAGDIRAVPLGAGEERVVATISGGLTGLAGI